MEVKIPSLPRDRRNILVLSCPEPSLAGVIAVEYLIDALTMEEIGYIRITDVPPVIAVVNGVAKLPYRIFYSRDRGIVAIRQHVPIPPHVYAMFIERLLSWVSENRVDMVLCLSAIPMMGDKPSDTAYFVSDEDTKPVLESAGLVPLPEATVTGLEAVFLDSLLSKRVKGALILAESRTLTVIKKLVETGHVTSHRDLVALLNEFVGRTGPDAEAALKHIHAISKIVGSEIPTDKLSEHAKRYTFLVEKNLEALMKPGDQRGREVPLVF